MDSEDSRDGGGDAHSSSSSSSSSSRSRSRKSSSSDRSETSNKNPKSPPRSPRSGGPRSPSPESRSPSPTAKSPSPAKRNGSPDYTSGHSDINSPETSMPTSPAGPKSPEGPHSSSDAGSNIGSPKAAQASDGPKSPASPSGLATSPPGSPGARSRPGSPDNNKSAPGSPENKSRPPSRDSASQPTSPSKNTNRSHSTSASPDRNSYKSSPNASPSAKKTEWGPKERNENWRRHTKAEQKMVPVQRTRSRSESSQSSRGSSYNKRGPKDPATEEISEGEMESDQEEEGKLKTKSTTDKNEGKDLNISHEDLSDVSDLDSVGPEDSGKAKLKSTPASPESKPETNVNGKSSPSSPRSDTAKTDAPKLDKVPQEKTCNTEDGEEQLDFEAEEGECIEPKPKDQTNGDTDKMGEKEDIKAGKRSRGSSLEEGEVSDEAERRPEESEPRPVCRFFSRGACTWGVSCRFLHPGVTDKGNYSMFEVVRGVPAAGSYPAAPARDAPPPESAWERGLRTAKEMLRIANKRKEQDMDFEEKKLHLSVGGVVHDPDAELAYSAAAVNASPPRQYEVPPAHYRDPEAYSRPYGPMYRGPGRYPRPVADDRERYYEREPPFERERAYERVPHYEDRMPVPEDSAYHKRRVRTSREVIVQRAEVERREGREGREVRREGRGDEWADPWMRAEPAARRRKPPSSDDSYSSSSSSNSSSRSSRSPGARRKRRASSSSRQRLSPSVIVRERRLATARATAMNPPAPRRRAPSPAAARQLAANPPAPAHHAARHKDEMDPYGRNKAPSRSRDRKKYSRSSSSGSESSSSSSGTESDSHSSSSSGSSGARRARHARLLNAAARPRLNAPKTSANLAAAVNTTVNKKEIPAEKEPVAKKRPASPEDAVPAKKSVSRREELLKQLKAVEDAIARKRSKI